MARSSYIYLVLDKNSTPLGSFTVKHELIKWLMDNKHGGDCVLRMPDGARKSPFEMRGTDISADLAISQFLRPDP